MAAIQKPSIPKGTRDFSPAEMARREYLFDTIKRVFKRYGYMPLETPSMENLSTLLGKYGEEGDKLLFRVMNSGQKAALAPEKGLRYDLTVPFARYVVQHQNEITFPFKRYQIQPVWRADRPQKGRYREFYQCDVDVVGTRSLLCEVELVQIVQEVFGELGVRVVLKMNNRKILAGIAEVIGFAEQMVDITVAIDKLDKVGIEAVEEELLSKGISSEGIALLRPILQARGTNEERLRVIADFFGSNSQIGTKGIEEVRTILGYIKELGVELPVELDLSLARGLNYYTGAIFEVKASEGDMKHISICGGGRDDDLTGIFGLPDTSGVGISFGADRIYDVMFGLGLFPAAVGEGARALFANFGGAEELEALQLLTSLRAGGVAAEIYPEAAKMKKQFDYAERRAIPYMVFVGRDEIGAKCAQVKNRETGVQQGVNFADLATYLNEHHDE